MEAPNLKPKLINLTPHDIIMVDDKCNPVLTIPRSGVVARAKQERKIAGGIPLPVENVILHAYQDIVKKCPGALSIPIVKNEYGEVENLPPPQPNTYYIVSIIVANAVAGKRDDVLYPDTGPGSVCRDEQGRIVGVRFLAKP